MNNYFIENKETGKKELHFDKSVYVSLDEALKKEIKSAFLWGRHSGCWISREKWPNFYKCNRVIEKLAGILEDGGTSGERLSFEEQQEKKIERAEARAEHYDYKSAAAEKNAENLQSPINKMHGDIAFFTQPNINTSSGRAFTRRRDAMWASFEKGFEELAEWAIDTDCIVAIELEKPINEEYYVSICFPKKQYNEFIATLKNE
jgi:hypothetical protein